jgi:hypothetical protein
MPEAKKRVSLFNDESGSGPIQNKGIVRNRTVEIAEKSFRSFIKSAFCCTCKSGNLKNTDFLVKAAQTRAGLPRGNTHFR